jgi:hypothetical protein
MSRDIADFVQDVAELRDRFVSPTLLGEYGDIMLAKNSSCF